MNDRVTGLIVDGKPIKPWRRACWDWDGRPLEACDAGKPGQRCAYHDQLVRIRGENAVVAWVEGSEHHPDRLEAYAWDPTAEEHIEVLTRVGNRYTTTHQARLGADRALLRHIERYREAQAR